MKISIIAVIGKNRELGKDNKLLWNIPADLKRFKKLTFNHTVIMGRKTFESIGHPLSNRINVVVSKNKKFQFPGVFVVDSLEKAFVFCREKNEKECFIIGGGQIYKSALPFADTLYLTQVDKEFKGADTFFPDYSIKFTEVVQKEEFRDRDFTYTFLTLRGQSVRQLAES